MSEKMEISRLADEVDTLKEEVRTVTYERDEAREKCDRLETALNEIYDIARSNT